MRWFSLTPPTDRPSRLLQATYAVVQDGMDYKSGKDCLQATYAVVQRRPAVGQPGFDLQAAYAVVQWPSGHRRG